MGGTYGDEVAHPARERWARKRAHAITQMGEFVFMGPYNTQIGEFVFMGPCNTRWGNSFLWAHAIPQMGNSFPARGISLILSFYVKVSIFT